MSTNLQTLSNEVDTVLRTFPSVYGKSPFVGFRQPYVFVTPDDSDAVKYIKRYDSLSFPEGSTIQDVERIGKFELSPQGLAFNATQFLLQKYNAFNETTLYNPLSILQSAARPGSLGLLPRAKRFIDVDGNASQLFGFSAQKTPPNGTLIAALPKVNSTTDGAGLQRARTGVSGFNRFSKEFSTSNQLGNSLLSQLASSIVTGLGPLPKQNGEYKVGDATILPTLLNNITLTNSPFSYLDSNGTNTNVLQRYSGGDTIGTYQFSIKPATMYQFNVMGTSTQTLSTISVADGTYIGTIKNIPVDQFVNPISQNGSILGDVLYEGFTDPDRLTTLGNINELNSEMEGILSLLNSSGMSTATAGGLFQFKTNIIDQSVITPNDVGRNIQGGYYAKQPYTLDGNLGNDFSNYTGKNYSSRIDKYNIKSVVSGSIQGNSDNEYTDALIDLIQFYFYDLVNNKFIPFRATLTGISMPNTADWDEIKYMGRADKVYIYKGFSRELSFSFKVYANSPEEMVPMWSRINYITTLVKPANYTQNQIGNNFIVPPFVKLTIGDLVSSQPVILKSIDLTVPDEASWELTRANSEISNYTFLSDLVTRSGVTLGQVPMMVEISISATILEKEQPQAGKLNFANSPQNFFGKSLL